MAEITLKSGRIGLTNINQDHYLRNHSMNLNGNDFNELLAARLGTTTKVNPNTLSDVALRSSGLHAQTRGSAYIEDGWDKSRGVALLTFEISNGGIASNTLGVYCYLYGGSPLMPGYPIPDDITFVPVRSWLVETTATANHQGFLEKQNVLRQAGQFLLNDPRLAEGSFAIRPTDIVANSLCLTTDIMGAEASPLGGGGDAGEMMLAGTTDGIIKSAGVVYTSSDNNSPVEYGTKLLESAMTASLNSVNKVDPYSSISDALTSPNMKEVPYFQNAFFRTMMGKLGKTEIPGFQGFTVGEIRHVFTTFDTPGVINTQLTDVGNLAVEDFRLNTNEHNGADYQTIICNDMLFTSIAVLDKARLSYMQIHLNNNTPNGQIRVNELPVEYQLGEAAPFMDEDTDWIYNVEQAAQRIAYHLYSKFNSAYVHERRLVTIQAEIALFGESRIAVYLDGNPATEKVLNFATAAGNRIDPTVTNMDGMQQQTFGFFNQLKNELGI